MTPTGLVHRGWDSRLALRWDDEEPHVIPVQLFGLHARREIVDHATELIGDLAARARIAMSTTPPAA